MADPSSRHTLAQRMAGEMLHNPQIIWRFLGNQSSLQGGQRNFQAFGSFLQLPLALQSDARSLLEQADRKSTRLNSSHLVISYAVFCLKKKNISKNHRIVEKRTFTIKFSQHGC